jgi:hypothetical protein
LTGKIRGGNGSVIEQVVVNLRATAAQVAPAENPLSQNSSFISQNSQILQQTEPTEDLFQVANMSNKEWEKVFNINNVFHGIRMGVGSEKEDHGPERTAFPLVSH